MEGLEMAKLAKTALEDKKAQDVVILDISDASAIADYFVIASAANKNQLAAMSDAVEEALGRAGADLRHIEGKRSDSWILMDYGDAVVHLFSQEGRKFYDLERIWGGSKRVED